MKPHGTYDTALQAGAASRDTEVAELNSQLAKWIAANCPDGWIGELRQQLSDSQGDVALLRNALVTIRDEPIETDEHDGIEPHVIASEALAATEPKT